MADIVKEGWLEDPADRHDYRWFSAGTPTDLVKDGHTVSRDAISITDAAVYRSLDLTGEPDEADDVPGEAPGQGGQVLGRPFRHRHRPGQVEQRRFRCCGGDLQRHRHPASRGRPMATSGPPRDRSAHAAARPRAEPRAGPRDPQAPSRSPLSVSNRWTWPSLGWK